MVVASHVLDLLFAQLRVPLEDVAQLSDLLLVIWIMRNDFAESITVAGQVLADLACLREDSVIVEDIPEFWSVYGYGSGGYGQVPYGGLSAYRQKNPDQAYIFEQLLMAFTALRSDEANVADSLLIASGYGGKLSSGYGLSPYGI